MLVVVDEIAIDGDFEDEFVMDERADAAVSVLVVVDLLLARIGWLWWIHSPGLSAVWSSPVGHWLQALRTAMLTRRRSEGTKVCLLDGDTQSRYIEAAVEGVLVGCIYLPDGNPQPGPKFAYKLAWFERLIAHAAELYATGLPVAIVGDYNVVPPDADIYPSKSWAKDALLQPESHPAFRRLLDQGWIDAVRSRHPVSRIYTFWDYKRDRWSRDAGLRPDYILLSPMLAERLTDAGVDPDVRGENGASDNAPAWVILDGRRRRKQRRRANATSIRRRIHATGRD